MHEGQKDMLSWSVQYCVKNTYKLYYSHVVYKTHTYKHQTMKWNRIGKKFKNQRFRFLGFELIFLGYETLIRSVIIVMEIVWKYKKINLYIWRIENYVSRINHAICEKNLNIIYIGQLCEMIYFVNINIKN